MKNANVTLKTHEKGTLSNPQGTCLEWLKLMPNITQILFTEFCCVKVCKTWFSKTNTSSINNVNKQLLWFVFCPTVQ